MNVQRSSVQGSSLPSLFTARPEARSRMRDFFSSHIRNKNTRRAYMEAVRQFSAFCAVHGIEDLARVEPGSRCRLRRRPAPGAFQAHGQATAGRVATSMLHDQANICGKARIKLT